jgi:hypothetical protein
MLRPAATTALFASLAVLPLNNLSGKPTQDYLADGMTEAMRGDVQSYAASGGCSRERSGRVWLSKISSSPSRNGPASPPTGLSIIASPR